MKIISLKVNPRFNYEVNIERIKSDGLESWVAHLREKNWFTPEMESNFRKQYKEE